MTMQKDPIITDRKDVITEEARRHDARSKLSGTVETARKVLSPRNQYQRFVDRSKEEARQVGKAAVQTTKKAAPVVGVLGLGTLIFLGRKPISKWISQLRNSKTETPDDKENGNNT